MIVSYRMAYSISGGLGPSVLIQDEDTSAMFLDIDMPGYIGFTTFEGEERTLITGYLHYGLGRINFTRIAFDIEKQRIILGGHNVDIAICRPKNFYDFFIKRFSEVTLDNFQSELVLFMASYEFAIQTFPPETIFFLQSIT